jgi:carboxyl-terminal processing protease
VALVPEPPALSPKGNKMSFRSKFLIVVASALLALYTVVGGWMSTRAHQQNDPGAQLRIFESVLQHIQHDYVDEPDLKKVRAGALRGLAYGLDPYSTYLTPEQVKDFRARKNGKVGIGAELSQLASYLYVIAPIKGSPAEKAGVQSGDIIEYIDNKATRDISLYDAKQLLQGPEGTTVKLRILRANSRPVNLDIKRAAFKTPIAEARMEAGKIGVIKVNSLDENESSDIKARLQDLMRQGADKILLDLRGVADGTLSEAVKVSNLFIRDGVLAQTVGRQNRTLKTFTASSQDAVFDGRVVVLIDRATAGAAEIIASAILERKRGEVVGEKSFGAGAEQQLFTLRDGDGLLLTTVKWAGASGKPFLGTGVAPSLEVKRPEIAESFDPEDLTGNDDDPVNKPSQSPDKRETVAEPQKPLEDEQLKKALELLRKSGNEKPVAQRRAA